MASEILKQNEINPHEHVGLVYAVFRRRFKELRPMKEYLAAGYMGLHTAARTFNPERGVDFGVYATIVIERAILRQLAQFSRTGPREGVVGLATPRTCYVEPETDWVVLPRLQQAMAQLSESERRLIRDRYIHGFELRMIADHEGVTKQAIEQRLAKVLRRVRGIMARGKV